MPVQTPGASGAHFRVSIGWVLRLAALWFLLAVVSHWVNVACGLPVRVAGALAAVARGLGIAARAEGASVLLPGYTLRVIEECTGLSVAGAMVAFALVAPLGWRTRVRGALLLASVALVWNALRLVGVVWVAQVAPSHVTFVHDVLWQIATVAVLLVSAALWVRASRARSA